MHLKKVFWVSFFFRSDILNDPSMWMYGVKKRLTLFNRRLPRRLGVLLEWSYGLCWVLWRMRLVEDLYVLFRLHWRFLFCAGSFTLTESAMKKVQIFALLILMQCVVHNSQYSQSSHRRKRSYKNTLLRMHHHSWSWEDILHGVYKVLQLFLVQQQQQPQMAAPREFLFFFDNSDNGSTPLFGLNISRRDAAYVSFPRSCSWNSGYFAINWTTFVRYQIGLEIINYL